MPLKVDFLMVPIMPTQKEIAEIRLKELGMGAIKAATSVGVPRDTVRDLIRGQKNSVRNDKVDDLARALRVLPGPLARNELVRLGEEEAPPWPKVGFTGRVGAGGSAINVEMDPDDARRSFPIIAGAPTTLRIAELDGDSLGALFNGWMVVYGQPVLFKDNLPYGNLCLVLTTDGEMTVKWLEKTRKRGVKLIDAAGMVYRDGVELQWAAPVVGMRPG